MSNSYTVFFNDADKDGIGKVRVDKVTHMAMEPDSSALVLKNGDVTRAIFAHGHWTQVRAESKKGYSL